MIYYAPTIIIILCYVIIILVDVALAALFSHSDSLLTILLLCVLYIVVLSNKYVPSFLPSFLLFTFSKFL